MTSDHGIHVGKPPFFDGNNYDYWKIRMSAHLKAMSRKLWRVSLKQKVSRFSVVNGIFG